MRQHVLSLFPREISRFFAEDAGHTLLVQGAPGTGKTLFTLRVLDVVRPQSEVLYVSSRIDQSTVCGMYLDDASSLDETNIVDLSQGPYELPVTIDIPFPKLNLDSLLEWIQSINRVTDNLTIAFDSWDLVHRYLAAQHENPQSITAMTTQLAALAREDQIEVLLVSEKRDPSALKYTVDGVVSPQVSTDQRGRTRRNLKLEKLRGVRIENRLQPFTLTDGTFQAIPSIELTSAQTTETKAAWDPLPNSKTTFSTGIGDFDPILDGGYDRGSVVHLDLGSDLSRDVWSVLTLPTIRNFVANEMCATVIPPKGGSPGLIQSDLTSVVDTDNVEEYSHVLGAKEQVRTRQDDRTEFEGDGDAGDGDAGDGDAWQPLSTRTDRLPPGQRSNPRVGTRSERGGEDDARTLRPPVPIRDLEYDQYIAHCDSIRAQSDGPLLHVINMDSIRSTFKKRLGAFANYIALYNDLAVLLTNPGAEFRKRTDRVADMHMKLERLGKAVVLYGENPLTPLLGIGIDRSGSFPTVNLIEMV
ncbi:gas vesicle protein GvpD basic region 2 domain-containing protein [Halorubrum sp. RMP-47]|uniref:Gas vesicle protein GvpD basic region 2 domain-containing protein n=1 Tax=Halorubrum miltondacostae TaxID=3076378 RepID=A0ABD5M8L8_9EURY